MPVDPAIHHQTRSNDCRVSACSGEPLCHQRQLERARHLEELNGSWLKTGVRHGLDKRVAAAVHDLPMPTGLNERNQLAPLGAACWTSVVRFLFMALLCESTARKQDVTAPAGLDRNASPCLLLFSLIRTMTVGSGVTPDLLTCPATRSWAALAGYVQVRTYRRWGVSPRPENAPRYM